ncbi:putative glucan 1,3-beta-glucosidase [Aureobasidium pullulans]|nr:putative glucan 1,3-beta-glucosidase [Aureobasidium pullulans]TIA12979.1 putative glucan 1,3-beta-glucosidase [Aureobasidium pullulans]
MRSITIVAGVVLAFSPLLVSAQGRMGFALGTHLPNASCKLESDYEADMIAIKKNSGSTLVRMYSSADCECVSKVLAAAKAQGFQVLLGVWPDDKVSMTLDKYALQTGIDGYLDQVFGVSVGSETMYRKTFTGPQLLEAINDVRTVLPKGVKVGTADSWNKFADGTADAVIKGGVDFLLANGFAYWQAQPITNATRTFFDDIQQALAHIQTVSGSLNAIEFWVGETGWPTDGGTNYGAAIASTKNAQTYYDDAICGMLAYGVNTFVFEAFDEPQKPAAIGDSGAEGDERHWGVMTSDRTPKFPLTC